MEVFWYDAECTGNSGWEDPAEMEKWANETPPTMHSVGYLIVDDPNYIVLLDTIGPNEVGTANKIPRGMIRTIRYLTSTAASHFGDN